MQEYSSSVGANKDEDASAVTSAAALPAVPTASSSLMEILGVQVQWLIASGLHGGLGCWCMLASGGTGVAANALQTCILHM